MDSSSAVSQQPVLDPSNGHRERRNHPRLQCKGLAEFRVLPDGPVVLGFLSNLCMGGCSIECEKELPAKAQEMALIEVQLDVDDFRLRLAGCIRHVEGNLIVGIQFTDVSSRKEEQIRHLMAELVEAEKQRLEQTKTKLDSAKAKLDSAVAKRMESGAK